MKPLRPIFLASFFFSFHLALISYLNSTVIAEHVSDLQTTLAYSVSSMLSLVLLVLAPRIVEKKGATKFLIYTLLLSILLLALLGTIASNKAFVLVFILYFALNTIIWYAFDLLIEHHSSDKVTGNIRGLYLTLNNAGWVTAPFIASVIAEYAGFNSMYILASAVVVLSAIFIFKTPKIKPKLLGTKHVSFLGSFRLLLKKTQARRLVGLYFVIQFFYALMVLYMAQYLLSLGFDWTTIGMIFSIMLLPFVLLQYIAGKIADKYQAERELIFYGFGIAAISTMALAFPLPASAMVFAAVLFVTRIGASLIEIGCESAFFKEVTDEDTAIIGTFRMTLPLAYIIAPLTGALLLLFGNLKLVFGFVAIMLAVAMYYSMRLMKKKSLS